MTTDPEGPRVVWEFTAEDPIVVAIPVEPEPEPIVEVICKRHGRDGWLLRVADRDKVRRSVRSAHRPEDDLLPQAWIDLPAYMLPTSEYIDDELPKSGTVDVWCGPCGTWVAVSVGGSSVDRCRWRARYETHHPPWQ